MPLQFLRGPRRWLAFFAAILVSMVAGGSVFLFPVYSKAIKTSLGYDNKALTMLAFSKNLGGSLGFLPSALIYDVAPPRAVLPFVADMNLLGVVAYVVPYLAVSGRMRIARPAVSRMLMCISIAVGANSQSFAMTGALVSSVKNFPDHRGPVLTLLLAFAGIGGDILAQLARASASADDDAVLLLLIMPCLCLVPLLFTWNSICVVPAPAGAARPGVQGTGVSRLLGVSAVAFALLFIFHVLDLVLPAHMHIVPGTAYYVTAMVLLLVVVIILLLVVVVKQESATTTTVAISGEATAGSSSSSIMLANNPPPPPSFRLQCYSILRAVFSVNMLLIFLVTMAIGGAIQTPIDMMDQIGQSLGYKHDGTTSRLVSLVSLLDYVGRLVGGLGSDYMLVTRRNLPRPVALTVAFLVACFGHLLIALGVRNGLYAAAAIMGFCIGALWTVVFVTISEVFGTKHLAALYNLAVLPSAVVSYVLNVIVTGRLYNRELLLLQQQRQASTEHTCSGVHCFRFREFFFILVGVTLFGAVVSAMLVLRPWQFYRAPIAAAGVVAPVTADRSSSKEDQTAV